jgi:fructoselysine-6-P-deglycase FrlB-like protein
MPSQIEKEIASQPSSWRQAMDRIEELRAPLPQAGVRLAIVGCGTSYYIAQVFAAARESRAQGESDAFPASEMPLRRPYGSVLAISRSGTTTEVVRLLRALRGRVPTVAITAVANSPVSEVASKSIVLDFADESSVVQTRFATTALALLRAHLGDDLEPVISDGKVAIDMDLPFDQERFNHFVFLGSGWTVGLANEAALKMREAAGAFAEAYPAMEYRHGPISCAGPATVVWALGNVPADVLRDVKKTGAHIVNESLDPMGQMVLVQRTAVARAISQGRDPDRPAFLTRSVILD